MIIDYKNKPFIVLSEHEPQEYNGKSLYKGLLNSDLKYLQINKDGKIRLTDYGYYKYIHPLSKLNGYIIENLEENTIRHMLSRGGGLHREDGFAFISNNETSYYVAGQLVKKQNYKKAIDKFIRNPSKYWF